MNLPTAVAVSMLSTPRSRAAAAFKEICRDPVVDALSAVLDACGVPRDAQPPLLLEARARAADALARAASAGIEPLTLFDERYPALLSAIADPPPVLWVLGDAAAATRPAVAIVGSRAASPYALEVGERLAAELAERGIVVCSGLARGVDSAAHRGCLEAGGLTVAVLGSGLDRVYPPEHGALAVNISRQGALVGELGPGAAPMPEHFPLRNRIISGISLGVVVVEASEKSGSLITARCALEQGRDVMAVPGSILSGRNRGSHSLLKDGAKVVETADDILEELGWTVPPAADGQSQASQGCAKSLSSDGLLTSMAAGEIYTLEALMSATGSGAQKLLPRLMRLELSGWVTSLGGGRFTRSTKKTS